MEPFKLQQAVKTLPTSINKKRIPRADTLCIPFTRRIKKDASGDQKGYYQYPLPGLGDEKKEKKNYVGRGNSPYID
eukprot:1159035-Pelagomonas_calceolata.AAC.8